ncbi:MAG: hypothetical protein AAFV95_09425 [Bacteroidota bacterium]
MAEQIIDYRPKDKEAWWRRKIRGLSNRLGRWQRNAAWWHHVRMVRPIRLDKSKMPPGAIPILINCYNRRSILEDCLAWMRRLEGSKCFLIVDNDSTYPPLLDYYKQLEQLPDTQVIRLGFNSWKNGVAHIGENLLNEHPYYVVTDPDLLPYPDTPMDMLLHLSSLMEQFPNINHIGLSLEIDDLPDHYPLKEQVVRHESQFWPPQSKALAGGQVFESYIDSTFAMYRPSSNMKQYHNALRTNRPYRLQHIDWYQDPQHLSEEFRYYLQSCKSFATWAVAAKEQAAEETKP